MRTRETGSGGERCKGEKKKVEKQKEKAKRKKKGENLFLSLLLALN